jgi:hypothetical protein
METKQRKVVALGTIALVAALGVGAVGHSLLAEPQTVTVEKLVPFEVVKTVEVTKEVPVEVIKTVEVVKEVSIEDESFLKMMCDRAMYDDLMECKEEVKAEDAALKLAIDAVKADLAEELEDADIVEDEKDVRVIKVYSDFEDVEVVESDFDSEEYVFDIKVKFEDEDTEVKQTAVFTVSVEDGESKIENVELI